jgi:hypothetical protein
VVRPSSSQELNAETARRSEHNALAFRVRASRLSFLRFKDASLPNSGSVPPANLYRRATRATLFRLQQWRPRQMAGFAKCSRGNHVLTSVHVEAVPALGALPAASRVFVVACSICRAALGTSIVGPAPTDARSRFHEASLAKTHPGRRQPVGETVRRLLKDEGR